MNVVDVDKIIKSLEHRKRYADPNILWVIDRFIEDLKEESFDMTYDEILREPSDKEKILQFIYDNREIHDVDQGYAFGWEDALYAVEDFIENKL